MVAGFAKTGLICLTCFQSKRFSYGHELKKMLNSISH